MLHPPCVNIRYWWCPFGNTPASDLFRELNPKGLERVKVLLLQSGDPRNILFSLWSTAAYDVGCNFEFTVCESEAALLARNLFLFSYVVDNVPRSASSKTTEGHADKELNILWNIFYHFYIPEQHITILQDHASKLYQLSETLDVWSASRYGKILNFTNQGSLDEVRDFWRLYMKSNQYSADEAIALEKRARDRIDTINEALSDPKLGEAQGYRSTGAHSAFAVKAMTDAMKSYWKTGVTAGNFRDVAALGDAGKRCLNPTMVIPSAPDGAFPTDSGHDPLQGFHLAEVFDNEMTKVERRERLAAIAKGQFRAWCYSFAKYVHRDTIAILVHCGDDINLCYELQDLQSKRRGPPKLTHLYTRPWSVKPLRLAESKDRLHPGPFDVIHTSNLIDHVGIYSILPAVVPLLSHTPFSVLFTECLFLAAKEPAHTLDAILFNDATASTVLLGIAPAAHLTGFTTDSVGTETYYCKASPVLPGRYRYLRLRIPWKWPVSGDTYALKAVDGDLHSLLGPVSTEPKELAHWLFSLYLNMFRYEQQLLEASNKSPFGGVGQQLAGDMRFYSRTNLAILLRFVKQRVETDWEVCMSSLLKMIEKDFSLRSTQDTIQEFRTRLHLCGVWRDRTLEGITHSQHSPYGILRPSMEETGVLHQSPRPLSVFAALVVPRSCLKNFTDLPERTNVTPRLYFSLGSEGSFEHHFFGIDCFFGKLKSMPESSGDCEVEEDTKQWRGSSDLIASCTVPTWMLLTGPRSAITTSLRVYSSPTSVLRYGHKLGDKMTVFQCRLDDEHLWILKNAPRASSSELDFSEYTESPSPPLGSSASSVTFNGDSTVKTIIIKHEFPANTTESKKLKEGAKVTVEQLSPCVLQLKIGSLSRRLTYPYPISGKGSTTKVSRERFLVQVEAPASSTRTAGGFEHNPFPVIFQPQQPASWNIPRLGINRQPLVSAPLQFNCVPHLVAAISEEDDAYRKTPQGMKTAFATLKSNVSSLFSSFVGRHPKGVGISLKAFALTMKNKTDTWIFTHALHHDRDSGSIFLEAFVVPLSDSRKRLAQRFLPVADLRKIYVDDAELTLWKQLLPALVERCRVSWDHKSSCQYIIKGRIPLSTAQGDIPICGCGEGHDVANFPAHLAGLANYATRIAIALLSAVPYVEKMPSLDSGMVWPSNSSPQQVQERIAAMSINRPRCAHCNTFVGSLRLCSRCEKVKYCSKECQTSAWREHKKDCRK